jgi:hypothetical protein
MRRDLVQELGKLQAIFRAAALTPDQHRMLRRRERRRAIDRVRGECLIVLDDDGVRACRRRAPQIRGDLLNARWSSRGRRILRGDHAKDTARAKDESRREGKPAHVSAWHVAVSSR